MSRPTLRAQLLTLPLLAVLVALPVSAQPYAAPAHNRPTTPATGARSATGATLTLEECIARAMQSNFDLSIQGFATANARESVIVAEALFDPTFAVTGQRTSRQAAQTGTQLEGSQNDTFRTTASIQQRIPTNGLVGVSTLLNRSANNNQFSTLNPAYDADVTLSVSQPLLRNFGRSVARANIDRSRIALGRSKLDYKARVLQVIRDTEAAYYNLAYAREQAVVRRFSLELAERLFEENQTRRSTGIATDLDVLLAEVGVANARRTLLQAEQTVRDREDALSNLIGQFEFDDRPGVVSLSRFDEPVPSFDRSYQLARAGQPDILSAQEGIRQFEIDLRNANSARRPTLDLNADLGYSGKASSFNRAIDRVPERESYAWAVGLTLRFPWGLHAENANYRTSLNNLSREQIRLRQLDQNLVMQVRSAVRAVETNLESVQISAKAVELSIRQFELEKARFDAGLSTFRRVQEAQADLDTARVSELQSRVTLQVAIADLRRLEGSSIERYQVLLPPEVTQ